MGGDQASKGVYATPREWYYISWVELYLVGGGMSYRPGSKEI